MTHLYRRIIVGLAGLVFLLLCWQAYQATGSTEGFSRVWAEPWGFVTAMDVFLGGICMAAIIFHHESNWRVALAWVVPILLLGHIFSALWVVVRFSSLATRH